MSVSRETNIYVRKTPSTYGSTNGCNRNPLTVSFGKNYYVTLFSSSNVKLSLFVLKYNKRQSKSHRIALKTAGNFQN